MAQIRLRNATGGTSTIGALVKVDPKNNKSFVYVTDLTVLPVIGAVAESVPNGNIALINLIGGYSTTPSSGNSYFPSGW
jgi:NADPH-dependent ferric siderophore reductase